MPTQKDGTISHYLDLGFLCILYVHNVYAVAAPLILHNGFYCIFPFLGKGSSSRGREALGPWQREGGLVSVGKDSMRRSRNESFYKKSSITSGPHL